MNDFLTITEYFKKVSTPDKVLMLMNDKKMIGAFLAWKSIIVKFNSDIEMCPYQSENERWKWLWECISFDKSYFQAVSGLKVQEVDSFFERLKGLKMIYPDGTVDRYCEQYLTSIIIDALKKTQKKSEKQVEKS